MYKPFINCSELIDVSAAPGPCLVHVSVAPGPCLLHVTAAPGPCLIHVSAAPGSCLTHVSAAPGPCLIHISAAPGPCLIHVSAAPMRHQKAVYSRVWRKASSRNSKHKASPERWMVARKLTKQAAPLDGGPSRKRFTWNTRKSLSSWHHGKSTYLFMDYLNYEN